MFLQPQMIFQQRNSQRKHLNYKSLYLKCLKEITGLSKVAWRLIILSTLNYAVDTRPYTLCPLYNANTFVLLNYFLHLLMKFQVIQ